MSFEFHENITLEMPDIKEQFTPFQESDEYGNSHKLITEIAAIHAGLTSNYNMYSAEALEAACHTWVTPYAKPIIMNHDEFSEPVGRVMASRMETESDGTKYTRLQVAILDPSAVERVMDKRYLTGSVGGQAESAKCSICQVDWAKEKMMEKKLPCRHRRGQVYEGKLAYLELGELSFREYSFVNIPADKNSSIRSITKDNAHAEDADDQWTHTVKMYSMDMNKPTIVEMSEAHSNTNILEGMKRKEAQATYRNIKGTFLSVSALDYRENDDDFSEFVNSNNTIYNDLDPKKDKKTSSQNGEESLEEKNMSVNEANEAVENTETVEDVDDILAVSEQLSADLAAEVTESDEVVADGTEQVEEGAETEAAESSESSDTETEAAEVEATATTEDEEEEDDAKKQLDTETTEDNAEVEQAAAADESASDATEKAEGSEDEKGSQEQMPPSRESEDSEVDTAAALAEHDKLKEENARLKNALHNMLVERVVDAKISRGVEESSVRAELITEHAQRTAASLADSLRDLERYPTTQATHQPTARIVEQSLALGDEKNTEVINESVEVVEQHNPVRTAERVFTDVLMGRIKAR